MNTNDGTLIQAIINTIDRYESTLLVELPRWAQ